jgi:hypothetical protein
MARQFPREDTLPWYRQFWPWFLILLPASVVVAGLSMLYIANRHADDLVADEYYKEGLAINRRLEKKERAAARGLEARLLIEGDQIQVLLSGDENAEQLELRMSHPLESDRDFSARLVRSVQGSYRGRLQKPVAPRWHWTLESPGPEAWRLDGSVVAADFADPGRTSAGRTNAGD